MKKAKLMLLAIAICGVSAAAIAFKASKFFGGTYYCLTSTASGGYTCLRNYRTFDTGDGTCTKGFSAITTLPNDNPTCTIDGTTYYGRGITTTVHVFAND